MYSFSGLIRQTPPPTFSDTAVTDRHSDTTFSSSEHTGCGYPGYWIGKIVRTRVITPEKKYSLPSHLILGHVVTSCGKNLISMLWLIFKSVHLKSRLTITKSMMNNQSISGKFLQGLLTIFVLRPLNFQYDKAWMKLLLKFCRLNFVVCCFVL